MARANIRGGERTVDELFSDDYRFEIPDYQRPDRGTTVQAAELLDDLLFALDATEDDPEPYFLGSLVLVRRKGIPAPRLSTANNVSPR